MILISHRGNISGIQKEKENSISYIEDALNCGYDVEVDIWRIKNKLFLGHDFPQYEFDIDWLKSKCNNLWIHCKNYESVNYFLNFDIFNFFWHQYDDISITSLGYIWVFPGKQPIQNSIAVLPELNEEDLSKCIGICSDYIELYKNL